MKAVLFDLDNTLYPEIDFVISGFKVISEYIADQYDLDQSSLLQRMLTILDRDGRGKIFDALLQELNLQNEINVELLVYLYRSHIPAIHLDEDVLLTFEYFKNKGIALGVITDGEVLVQRNKIFALGLESMFDVIIYTDLLGRNYWKPSTVPFDIALDILQVSYNDATYVGDDISKDFRGPNYLGMTTIQITRNEKIGFPEILTDSSYSTAHTKPKFIVDKLGEIISIGGKYDDYK